MRVAFFYLFCQLFPTRRLEVIMRPPGPDSLAVYGVHLRSMCCVPAARMPPAPPVEVEVGQLELHRNDVGRQRLDALSRMQRSSADKGVSRV